MFRGKNKDIITTPTSSVSLVDFEQVNICWDVIKSLFNDFWSILKILCRKCCSRPSCFYCHNAFMYSFFKKKIAGDTFTYIIWRQVKQRMARVKLHLFLFHLKFVKMKFFTILALKQPNSEKRIFAVYKYSRRLLKRTLSPKYLSNNLSL